MANRNDADRIVADNIVPNRHIADDDVDDDDVGDDHGADARPPVDNNSDNGDERFVTALTPMEQMMQQMMSMFTVMQHQREDDRRERDEERAHRDAERLQLGRELAKLRQQVAMQGDTRIATAGAQETKPSASSVNTPATVQHTAVYTAHRQSSTGAIPRSNPHTHSTASNVHAGHGDNNDYVMLSRAEYARLTDAGPSGNLRTKTDNGARACDQNSVDGASLPPALSAARYGHRRLYDLPSFSGRPEEWPLFYHTFVNSTEAYEYTELENLMRLQKGLVGAAKKAVERILIHPRHVGQVMATLEKEFGRPEILLRSQLQAAHALPTIREERLEELGPFSTAVQNLATFLDTEDTQQYLANPALLDELVAKLPMARRLDWACVSRRILPYPTVKDFAEWVTELADMVNRVCTRTITSSQTNEPRTSGNKAGPKKGASSFLGVAQTQTSSTTNSDATQTCAHCTKNHRMADCHKFLRLNVDERWKEVTRRAVCFGCLNGGHMLPSCPNKRQCNVDSCTRWHNPALHNAQPTHNQPSANAQPTHSQPSTNAQPTRSQESTNAQPARSQQPTNAQTNISPAILNCREGRDKGPLLFRVVPVVLHARNRKIHTHALLDDGSSVTLMDAGLANELHLDGPQSELDLQWFGRQTTVEQSHMVSFEVSGMNERQRYAISAQTVQDLSLPTQTVDASQLKKAYKHLRAVPFDSFTSAEPKLLIGLDNHHLGVPIGVVAGHSSGQIVAAQTRLGWCVYGSDSCQRIEKPVVLHIGRLEEEERYKQLDQLVRTYVATEEFGVKMPDAPVESDEAIRARALLQATTRRVGERFETGLLWRKDGDTLPDSRDMALSRLRGVESKMRRDAEYARQYQAQIIGYVNKGYARKLSKEEADARVPRTWYLPHFAVTNPNKPGKFRLVFDAAAMARGESLNAALLPGPDENVPLVRLLFRFRIGLVGVCADIREMFHQVRIRPADQNAQRFLWRDGETAREPDTYVMQVMTFGSTCSPASAQYVKNYNAEEHRLAYPEAADVIQNGHYVDDYVASFATPEEAARITTDVVNVHKRGGFELRGFLSNSAAVLNALGVDEGCNATVRMEPDDTPDKILGMNWSTSEDAFTFKTKFNRVDPDVIAGRRRPTKREMLSTIMSVFDPFGFLADFLLTGKILLQDLWRVGTSWDEQVPEDVDQRWQRWRSQIEETERCRIPRCYSAKITNTHDLQLHIFCDASEIAFAAVGYWRVDCGNGIELAFVAGKTKCAPLKLLSVPRLELQAAVLGTRLLNEIRASHDLQIHSVTMWTDSQTVLQWLRSDRRRYKPFVAFRVSEIAETIDSSHWRWCPTALNVADDATRVKAAPTFDPASRWIHGPPWLRDAIDSWPMEPTAALSDVEQSEEVRRNFVGILATATTNSFIGRFSRYVKLRRVTAWLLRFAANARKSSSTRIRGELSASEIDAATRTLCRIAQREVYPAEYATVQSKKSVATTSELFKLNLYLDDDGLLRLHGRTDAACDEHLPMNAKRPILLPRKHHLTRLMAQHEHENMAHQFEDATAATIRRTFWVPQLRVLVRSIRRQCMSCRIRTARPAIQPFGQLPRDRLTPFVRPFRNTGLDYFGPIDVAIGRRREKRWVAIFTCLSVRAVHLEIAADLSTDSCLMVIRNFANLRGPPARIRCDNGTNFVGAKNELAREHGFFDADAMQRELSSRNIEWVFNCPSNPEAGGAWERLIQSVKRVLSVTLKEVVPRVETLRSLLLEAANILNARPLTHLPVNADDEEPITPNDFLVGGMNAAMTPASTDNDEPLPTRRQWKVVQELSRRFWMRWLTAYLPELTRRSRHYANVPPLRDGALVLICESNQPRARWLRGRIIKTFTGSDGVVRTAEVQTANGILRRPVTKLAVLDVESASD